jgi:hypothetical protein
MATISDIFSSSIDKDLGLGWGFSMQRQTIFVAPRRATV